MINCKQSIHERHGFDEVGFQGFVCRDVVLFLYSGWKNGAVLE